MATKTEIIERALALGIIARKSEWTGIPVKSAEWEACLSALAKTEQDIAESAAADELDAVMTGRPVLRAPDDVDGQPHSATEWNDGERTAHERSFHDANEDDEPTADGEFLNNLIQNGESEESAQAAADEYKRCCTKHYDGPMDPLGYLTGTPEPMVEDCEVGEFDRGGPHDRVANPPARQSPGWVDLVVENQIVWPEPKHAPEPMAMNRHQRRAQEAMRATREQRVAGAALRRA